MDVRPVEQQSMDSVGRLLRSQDLPTEDLDEAIEMFGAYDNEQLIGVVGLQRCASFGLLRSLAVVPAARHRGVALVLCERVFARARELEFETLWLLTTSARDYFTRRGFEAVERAQVPDSIRETSQFASLCPASAVVMRRG